MNKIISRMGYRQLDRRYDWSVIRLLWIAREQQGNVFRSLPAELVMKIAKYCTSTGNAFIEKAIARQEALTKKKKRGKRGTTKSTGGYPWVFESVLSHIEVSSEESDGFGYSESDSD